MASEPFRANRRQVSRYHGINSAHACRKWADPPEIPLFPEKWSSYPKTLRFAPKAGAFLAKLPKEFFLAGPGFLCGQLQSHPQLATPCPAANSFADNYPQLGDNHRSWEYKK